MAFDVFWMNVAAVFAVANVVLVLLLMALYYQSWKRIRSTFTASLIVFSLFFLIQNVVIVVFWFRLYDLVPAAQAIVVEAAPYLVLINLFETAALGGLVRVTWG